MEILDKPHLTVEPTTGD